MTPVRAHIGHAPHLLAILWAFTRATPWLPQVRSRLTDMRVMAKVIHRGWVQVVYDRYGPAGFIARDGGRIHALYVHPRARGQGLGRTLLDDAKARARQLDLWVLQANTAARGFYARHGFAETTRTHGAGNDENLPDIRMVWQASHRGPQ
ncbi:GNAT family N-acetyltransferase [Roseovarius gahaiensis]|uniref:GNAT family N-acetyltransferase n=1 Tax=Roseovarius gahaiensis TaxID=2716691 RepID=A0A967BAS1_9RHOB|nr:GNAT family N-acetyltransferase [Roseovarius gahaiensis]